MATTIKDSKPDILQVCDKWIDREYLKIVGGAILRSEVTVRADRMKEWKEWHIDAEEMPDKLFINGKEIILNL